MASPLVSFQHVAKRYKYFQALHDVNFDLQQGEVFGYIGPNGAGKTTTLKCLVGLIQNFEGKVTVGGYDLKKEHDKVHHLIGYLPQSADFQNWRSVDNALMSLGMLSDVPKSTLEKRIPELLERFDLADVRHKKIKQLSGGMKQKVGFIQALLHRPKLLVLDEPLSGLDPFSRSELKAVIRELRAEGTTIIFSSHILSDVQDVADRIGVIWKGRTLTTGTLEELKMEFGVPKEIHLDFSQIPDSMDFIDGISDLQEIEQRKPDYIVLRLNPEAAQDEIIHHLITSTLTRNGKIRMIGNIPPSLDELYKNFVRRAAAADAAENTATELSASTQSATAS